MDKLNNFERVSTFELTIQSAEFDCSEVFPGQKIDHIADKIFKALQKPEI